MKTAFLAFVFLVSTCFGQNLSLQKDKSFKALVTEEQKKEILSNLKKMAVYVKETNKEYFIYQKGEIYASLNKYPKYANLMLGDRDTISLFELKCKEEIQEFFGVALEYRDADIYRKH